jgi:hypothetical protein
MVYKFFLPEWRALDTNKALKVRANAQVQEVMRTIAPTIFKIASM